ncbi:MAG: SusD/RagB family nutrient-binding outer membrane lipoprotein [Paludibacter sp.]|nr:SusD/RagB family nutrient-binding outer membrane lipoprotein [Paludibacter sp.]
MKYLNYIMLVLIVANQLSCSSDFEEINENPNVPKYWELSPVNLLEETIFSGADGMRYRTWLFTGELIQYTVSGTSNNAYHRYVIGNSIMASTWNSLYVWAANADHMRQLARLDGKKDINTEAMALTLRTLFMSNATDIFGDIPCSEAFKSLPYYDEDNNYVEETNLFPKFDAQEDVYKQLFATLEKANALFDVGQSIKSPSKDLIYGGDITKWKKFNNSLYLRLLMRLSNRNDVKMTFSADGSDELTVFEKINEILNNPIKYPIFTSNDDNASLNYSGITPFINGFGDQTEGAFNGRNAAEQIVSMMDDQNDPRISTYFVQRGGAWNGVASGKGSQDTDASNSARLNKSVLGNYTSPYALMKYDEVLFILCEATKLGVIPGGDLTASDYYRNAITTSIRYWVGIDPNKAGITDEAITNFIDNYAPYDGTIENILNQKYIAMFWVGYEAWHDYRRTGYPKLNIGYGTFNEHILPTRFEYPINTAKTNPENYNAAVERLKANYGGDDNMRSPVWWSRAAAAIK